MAQFAARVYFAMHSLMQRRVFCLAPLFAGPLRAEDPEVWVFDRLDRLGNHAVIAAGNPTLIDTPGGKAIEFNGEDDALFVDAHPLAGATAFSWEVVFRPASGGRAEQRFFHLQETGSTNRMLFETRLIGKSWYLDSFVASNTGQKALMDRSQLHPLDVWHHAAMVYDGRQLRHYVNHKLEISSDVQLSPQSAGKCSVGVRYNKVDYFKGAIRYARFHRKAISPSEFHSWK